ncbi:hypothetical protein [Chryseobacterium rhizosphaerae]|uniref:Uncharacterized protein n=1 Tax=Chryseobacterium rhizosphaerae TaxID=395937 RepID=A0ABX9IDG2_9FLAO|nr:hypothetical protein [Chryseobacterium rhizosphaerae]REC69761.1 hypothetical protein DRF57_23015 [Chryseobacterium rhizosphaerae]GEN69924.1 hypothetical protein CRH01_44920 [Chryseobacterium rhizosphaerae]
MRNIWFTIYSSTKDDNKYIGLNNYRTLLEILLIPAIQDKINREKKAQKIMFCLIPQLEKDLIDNFKSNYVNKKIVNGGIINLEASSKGVDWNDISDQERKDFLIEKWKVLFNNLSDDYFVTDKSEVIASLDELKNKDWKITRSPFKRKVKYNKENYAVVLDVTTERAQLALVRDSDNKWFVLRIFETSKIQTDANFKGFQLDGDTLKFIYKNPFNAMFESPVIFSLKEIIN